MRHSLILTCLLLAGCGRHPQAEPTATPVRAPATQPAGQVVRQCDAPPVSPQPAPVVQQADLRSIYDEIRSLREDLGRTTTRVDQLGRDLTRTQGDLDRLRRERGQDREGGRGGW